MNAKAASGNASSHAGEDLAQDKNSQEHEQANKAEIESLKPLCLAAEANYQLILGLIMQIKAAEAALARHYHGPQQGQLDLDRARRRYNDTRQEYHLLGNQINEGIRQVYTLSKRYPKDLLVQTVYKTYLAKLLASLETRNPLQPLVSRLAKESFYLDTVTYSSLNTIKYYHLLEETRKIVVLLEVRYQKRQCANMLREGTPLETVIERVSDLLIRDPADINTYIWLFQMKAALLGKEQDHQVREQLEENLNHICDKADAVLEEYIYLQGFRENAAENVRQEYQNLLLKLRMGIGHSAQGD